MREEVCHGCGALVVPDRRPATPRGAVTSWCPQCRILLRLEIPADDGEVGASHPAVHQESPIRRSTEVTSMRHVNYSHNMEIVNQEEVQRWHDDQADLEAHVDDERQSEQQPICSNCKQPIELSSDLEHYEDTGMLCDQCLADKLGIAAEGGDRRE